MYINLSYMGICVIFCHHFGQEKRRRRRQAKRRSMQLAMGQQQQEEEESEAPIDKEAIRSVHHRSVTKIHMSTVIPHLIVTKP